MIERILSEGRGHWLREAVVNHYINPDRQTASYLRSYFFDIGFVASMRGATKSQQLKALPKLVRAVRAAVKHEARLLRCRLQADHGPGRGAALMHAAMSWGRALGWLTALVNAKLVADWQERTHE